ncbi:hypothetical protein IWQ62_003499 [Dispira parvispora]|uniref:Uncharacterized protein n=1 Tax=Dispira parvispora TaxID=1520584 RepID=A0A9W8AU22_9FUNG|nr:hypothetical protein IWQ62_003499 [Dispira parvispora]
MVRFSAVVFACVAVASVSALPQQLQRANSATDIRIHGGVGIQSTKSRGNYGQQYAPQQQGYGNYAQGGGSSVGDTRAYRRW